MTVHFPKPSSASAAMKGRFPAMALAINPPLVPMEARDAAELPSGAGWLYEPKWDGLRCLAFRDGRTVVLQSKSGEPLTRYFPEIMMALSSLPEQRYVLDGEVVVIGAGGRLSYDDLMGRIHPSARKVAQLSARTPATLLGFDLLAEGTGSLLALPLGDRRKRLEAFFKAAGPAISQQSSVQLSPATAKRAEALGWLKELAGAGLDGLVAKKKDEPYRPGEREAMVKVKLERTADCVVAGVRRAADGGHAGLQLLLGLHDDEGLLHFVGTTLPLDEGTVKGLGKLVDPLLGGAGFSGRQPPNKPGIQGPKGRDFEPLRPHLVAEVRFDRFVDGRFRSAPTFLRWRTDKKPARCTIDELRPAKAPKGPGLERLGL